MATAPGQSGRIVVRCSDGTIIDKEFTTTLDLGEMVGRLVRVEHSEDGRIRLVFIDQPDGDEDNEA